MLQSLLALPLGVIFEVLVFLALYLLSPMSGRQAALAVAMLSVAGVVIFSLIDWPGADVIAMYVAVLVVAAYLLGIISYSREQRLAASGGRGDGRWFHWGPAIIIIFFITLFAVDGVMVVISSQGLPKSLAGLLLPESAAQKQVHSAFPGTVANDFQKKEGMYNEYLQQVKRQQQRGWQVSKGWLVDPVVGQQASFQVRVSEQDGAPVRFAQLSGTFQRPSDSRLDQPFEMGEVEPGLYRVVLSLPEPGVWNLVLHIKRGEQLHELHASTSVAEPGLKQE